MIKNVITGTNNLGFYIFNGKNTMLCRHTGQVVSYDRDFVYLQEPNSNWITPIDEYGYEHPKILFQDLLNKSMRQGFNPAS